MHGQAFPDMLLYCIVTTSSTAMSMQLGESGISDVHMPNLKSTGKGADHGATANLNDATAVKLVIHLLLS